MRRRNRKYFFNRFAPVYAMADATSDAGGGATGGDGATSGDGTTSTGKPDQAAIDAAIAEALKPYQGLKSKNAELLEELANLKKTAKKFDGVDVDGLLELRKKVEQDEILKLHAEGKHSDAYNRMMEKERATFQSEREKLANDLQAAQDAAKTNQQLVETLLIDGGAQAEFAKAAGLPEATPDILARARTVWQVEDGATVARDRKTGELLRGENGPLTMKEWIKGLKKEAPHLFMGSRGAGAMGAQGEQGGAEGLEAEMLAASEAGDINKLRELRKRRYTGPGTR